MCGFPIVVGENVVGVDRESIINKGKIVVEDTPERLQARLSGSRRVIIQVGGDDQTNQEKRGNRREEK